MKVFIDSSAWIAYFNSDDDFHSQALEFFKKRPRLVTSNVVLHEAVVHLENRVGRKAAERAAVHILNPLLVELIVISKETENKSLAKYQGGSKKISFVDWTNFVLMKEHNIKKIFAFDEDFKKMGLGVVP